MSIIYHLEYLCNRLTAWISLTAEYILLLILKEQILESTTTACWNERHIDPDLRLNNLFYAVGNQCSVLVNNAQDLAFNEEISICAFLYKLLIIEDRVQLWIILITYTVNS